MTYLVQFESLLRQMDHEDTLLLARTQWLVVSQCLLLVAYFCIDKKRLPASPHLNQHTVIAVLGITTTVFMLSAILAAVKVFVELRSDMFALLVEHPDLPMRMLPKIGIGAGLLCPILFSLAFIFTWSLLAFSTWRSSTSMALSGSLVSLSIIGSAHGPTDPFRSLFLVSLIAGIAFFIDAIWLGARSVRNRSSTT